MAIILVAIIVIISGLGTACQGVPGLQGEQGPAGPTGETDKRVFFALCHRAHLDGRKEFRASIREVAEIAGVTKNTAHRSLKRLIQAGLISLAGRDSGSGANLYKFSKKNS